MLWYLLAHLWWKAAENLSLSSGTTYSFEFFHCLCDAFGWNPFCLEKWQVFGSSGLRLYYLSWDGTYLLNWRWSSVFYSAYQPSSSCDCFYSSLVVLASDYYFLSVNSSSFCLCSIFSASAVWNDFGRGSLRSASWICSFAFSFVLACGNGLVWQLRAAFHLSSSGVHWALCTSCMPLAALILSVWLLILPSLRYEWHWLHLEPGLDGLPIEVRWFCPFCSFHAIWLFARARITRIYSFDSIWYFEIAASTVPFLDFHSCHCATYSVLTASPRWIRYCSAISVFNYCLSQNCSSYCSPPYPNFFHVAGFVLIFPASW